MHKPQIEIAVGRLSVMVYFRYSQSDIEAYRTHCYTDMRHMLASLGDLLPVTSCPIHIYPEALLSWTCPVCGGEKAAMTDYCSACATQV